MEEKKEPCQNKSQAYQEPCRKYSSVTHEAQDIKDKKRQPVLGRQVRTQLQECYRIWVSAMANRHNMAHQNQ